MFFISGILLITLAVYFSVYNYNLIRAFYLSLRINGPPALPIIGNALMVLARSPTDIFRIIVNIINQNGVYFRIWLGPELEIIISDPKDIEIILSSTRHIDKASAYEFMKPWLNDGLLLSTGKKWHNRRKVITPAFHFNILEKFAEVFDRLGNTVVNKLNDIDSSEVEIYPIAALYALDVMCETAMGVSIDALSYPDSDYVRAVKKYVQWRWSMIFLYIIWLARSSISLIFQYSKLARTHTAALHVLHGFTDDVIRKRRQELLEIDVDDKEKSDQNDEENESIGIRKRRALLDLLLHSTIDGKQLTDLEIREEVDTFMFEGHDTTTSGITFCLYNIAKHPEVQRKCFSEIVEVFGSNTREPTTLSKLNLLSYLEITIKESLRLFPSVPFIARIAMEDIELTKNRLIPTGANIVVPIYTIQRNEEYFEDAESFKPERFLEERSMEKQSPFNYIPFSAGPRNCVGQKFAMYEIKSIVSKMLRNYEISLTEASKAPPVLSGAELILRPESSIFFQLKRRVY